jgi:hypothetical protein
VCRHSRSLSAFDSKVGIIKTDLVEKNILAVSALRREFLQIAILVYSMFKTELLPELAADYKTISLSPYAKSG